MGKQVCGKAYISECLRIQAFFFFIQRVTDKPHEENFGQLPIQVLQVLFQILVGLQTTCLLLMRTHYPYQI
jgi:hypothetical protein